MGDVDDLLSAFRYLIGDRSNICRLCFDAIDTGVSLDESCLVESFYYDDTVTFAHILTDLGAHNDHALPQLLCKSCADLAMKAFLFRKLSLYSYNKWHEAIERLNQTLNSANIIEPGAKTAYFLLQQESKIPKKKLKTTKEADKKKEASLDKITKSGKSRRKYENNNKEKFVICSQCGKKIISKQLTTHMKRVHNDNKYLCPNCDKTFKDPISLRDHGERIHAIKTIPCPKCDKKFSTDRMLRQHNTLWHVAVPCKHCSELFPSREAAHAHARIHDLRQCPRCNKMKTNAALVQHMKTCGDSPHVVNVICDICNKGFKNKSCLKAHLATKHDFGNAHICKWCNKRLYSECALKEHIVRHTREKNFSCQQCGKVFLSKISLTYHTRLHTGEKPFSCDFCGEKFLSASRRMDHMRRKHLEPQHLCSICGSKFTSKFSLNKHVGRHKDPQSKLFVSD